MYFVLLMKKSILILYILFFTNYTFTQNVDSLIEHASTIKNDSIRCGIFTKICFELAVEKPKQALYYGFKAKEIAEKLNSKFHKQRVYDVMAQCYDALKDYTNSVTYFRKALTVNATTKDLPVLANIYNNYALSFHYQGKLDSSLFYHFKSLAIRKSLNDKLGTSKSYNNIGLVYRVKRDYQNAIKYYNLSLALKREIGDKRGEFNTLNNIGVLYKNLKQYDSAYIIFEELTKTAEKANAFAAFASSSNNMALCLNSMKRYAEALKIMSALNNDERTKNIADVYPLVIFGLGEANAGLKKYRVAFNFLKRAEKMTFPGTQLEYMAEIQNLLSSMAEANGDFQLALAHYKNYRSLLDSLYNENNLYNINELTAKYEANQKEQHIMLLNKENELKDARLKEKENLVLLLQAKEEQRFQQMELLNKENEIQELSLRDKQNSLQLSETKNKQNEQQINLLNKEKQVNSLTLKDKQKQTLLALMALAIVTAIALGAFILYRNKQKANHQLEEKNNIIQKSLEEKEILLKEIHHRVKNNLQVVSSLLNLQSRNIHDEKALEAIKEGRDRVKSMALIHQNLYDDDNLRGVDVKDYIEKLTQSLFNSYNIEEEKINLKTEIDNLNLDVDSVVPIGLILTELISNSLKYAFTNTKQNGELFIKLKQQKGNLLLQVKDNGQGLPQNWSYETTTSLGYQLIRSFAAKMKAMLTVNGSNGTDVQMLITKYQTTS